MRPESDFYQISGFRAHSNRWFEKFNDKQLIDALASVTSKLFRPGGSDAPIELVLGILPSGASYLLMTSEQMHQFTQRHKQPPPRDPWRADRFLSLSPIYFNSRHELEAKIKTYKQVRKKNRRDGEETQDNSQANKGYVQTGTNAVHYRAYFEHQRTLYRLFTRELTPGKVGLVSPPWLSGVRIVSLVIGEWTIDNRPRNVRLKDPKLVDVGWTETSFPDFFERLTGSTVHLNLSPPKLKNSSSKAPYFSNEVVGADHAGLYARLHSLFDNDTNKSTPLIVLVHDEDMARSVLSSAGIDVASWSSGLSELLSLKNHLKLEDEANLVSGPYIIDTQKLVRAVTQASPGYTVPRSAAALNMQTDTRTCAGDDSLLQLRMWLSMAQGLAIDEQHKQRSSQQPDCAQVLAPPQEHQQHAETDGEVDPNDNDVDPNDMGPGPRPTAADDFSDDDDW